MSSDIYCIWAEFAMGRVYQLHNCIQFGKSLNFYYHNFIIIIYTYLSSSIALNWYSHPVPRDRYRLMKTGPILDREISRDFTINS